MSCKYFSLGLNAIKITRNKVIKVDLPNVSKSLFRLHIKLRIILMDKVDIKTLKDNTDRFIPSQVRTHLLAVPQALPLSDYQLLLQQTVLKDCSSKTQVKRLLGFSSSSKQNVQSSQRVSSKANESKRKIPTSPFKILEAPNLQDDFYLNLLDWSCDNLIAVGLDSSVTLWKGHSTQVQQLYYTQHPQESICSVCFGTDPNQLSFGTSFGTVQLFDVARGKQVRQIINPINGRIGSINWFGEIMAVGTRDGQVVLHDIRSHKKLFQYSAHQQEICGLKWSPDGTMIASGGNDNRLVVWSMKKAKNLKVFCDHVAAVKAIGWSPHSPGIIASGGGTADQHIRFFSTNELCQIKAINTGSQVCNLMFSSISDQLVSTHGYSLNQINVWKAKVNGQIQSVQKLQTLTGHSYRVLYLAGSPDGSSIVTGAGDQTLRFWNVFNKSVRKQSFLKGRELVIR